MDDMLLFPCSYGEDDPERATVPFIPAAAAAASGKQAVVVCTVEASWLATPDARDRVAAEGLPVLGELYRQFVDAGGEVWVCSVCATKRGIGEDDLAEGARIVGAAQIVEALTRGRAITLT